MSDILELGAGDRPRPDSTIRHDRTRHSDHIDTAWDLDVTPWPWADDSMDGVIAIDVLEHLRLDIADWMDELWRITAPDGTVELRLPAWDNPMSWRDPTHRRVFGEHTLHYWDVRSPLCWEFGRIYFSDRWPDETPRWWRIDAHGRCPDSNDFRWKMRPAKQT